MENYVRIKEPEILPNSECTKKDKKPRQFKQMNNILALIYNIVYYLQVMKLTLINSAYWFTGHSWTVYSA